MPQIKPSSETPRATVSQWAPAPQNCWLRLPRCMSSLDSGWIRRLITVEILAQTDNKSNERLSKKSTTTKWPYGEHSFPKPNPETDLTRDVDRFSQKLRIPLQCTKSKGPMKRFRVGSSSSSFEAEFGGWVDQNCKPNLGLGLNPDPNPGSAVADPRIPSWVWFQLSSAIRVGVEVNQNLATRG